TRFSRDWSSDVCSSDLVPYTLYAIAQQEHLPSSVAGVINATTPLWTLACELAFGARRPGASRLVGLGVGFAGTLLIFAPWDAGRSEERRVGKECGGWGR